MTHGRTSDFTTWTKGFWPSLPPQSSPNFNRSIPPEPLSTFSRDLSSSADLPLLKSEPLTGRVALARLLELLLRCSPYGSLLR